MVFTRLATTLAVLAAMAATTVLAQQPPAPAAPPAQGRGRGGGQPVQPVQQVKPGLFMVAGGGATTIIRVTADGLILVDGKLPGDQNYDALMTQIKTVTDKPVRFVVVAHHHADHTGSNAKFLESGAQVVGHENLKKNLLTYQFTPLPAAPSITYDKDHVVRLGGVEVQVRYYGRSHTSGDSIAFFPDLKVVALGDTVTTGATGPLIDYAGGGSAVEWTRVLDAVLALDFDTAIPGNGPVMTKADVRAFKAKFDTVVTRATDAIRKGVPKDQLLAQSTSDEIGWTLRVPQIDSLYEELSKAK